VISLILGTETGFRLVWVRRDGMVPSVNARHAQHLKKGILVFL